MENPANSFLSGRGYHPTRRSFRRTDGRQRVGRRGLSRWRPVKAAGGLRSANPAAASVTAFAADRRSIPSAAPPPASAAARCPLV
jgi:hypothetical protein